MTERELNRAAERRLAILRHAEEVSGNVAATCRYYGIIRQAFYTWRQRYEKGLVDLRNRSRAPHRSPRSGPKVFGNIIYLGRTTTSTRTRSRYICGAATT